MQHAISTRRRRVRGAALPALILLAWEAATRAYLVDPRILPPLEMIAHTAYRLLFHGSLLFDLAVSLLRDMAGFVAGTFIGMVMGIVLGLSRLAERLVLPSFDALRQIACL